MNNNNHVLQTCKLLLEEVIQNVKLNDHELLLKSSETMFHLLTTIKKWDAENLSVLHDVVYTLCLPYLENTEAFDKVTKIYINFILSSNDMLHYSKDMSTHCLDALKHFAGNLEDMSITRALDAKLKLLKLLLLESNNLLELVEIKKDSLKVCFQIMVGDIKEADFLKICNFSKDMYDNSTSSYNELLYLSLKQLQQNKDDKKTFILMALNLIPLSQSPYTGNVDFLLMIQNGLTNADPLTRKRSLFILKWFIDHISKSSSFKSDVYITQTPLLYFCEEQSTELWDMWKSYILVMESLEEKQVHVIQPIYPLIYQLYQQSCNSTPKGTPILHFSWFMKILQRGMYHDSKLLVKWSLQFFLEIDFKLFPLLEDKNYDFILNDLFELLKQSFLYIKDESANIGYPPLILKSLKTFFKNVMNCLDYNEQLRFTNKILDLLTTSKYSDISILYILKAFTKVQMKGPLNEEELLNLKKLLFCMQAKYQVEYQRVGLQMITKFCLDNVHADTKMLNIKSIILFFTQGLSPSIITKNYILLWGFWMKKNKVSLVDKLGKRYFSNSANHLTEQDIKETFFHFLLQNAALDDNNIIVDTLTSSSEEVIMSSTNNVYYPKVKMLNLLKYFNSINSYLYSAYAREFEVAMVTSVNMFQSVQLNIMDKLLEYFFFTCKTFGIEVESIIKECFAMFEEILNQNKITDKECQNCYGNTFITKFSNKGKSFLNPILNNIQSINYEQQFLLMKVLSVQLQIVNDIKFTKYVFDIILQLLYNINRLDLYNYFKGSDWKWIDSGHYIETMWFIIQLCLKKLLDDKDVKLSIDIDGFFDRYVSDLDLIPRDRLLAMVDVSKYFVHLFQDENTKSLLLCETVWRILKTQTQNDHSFWKIYNSCIDTIFHEKFLLSSNQELKNSLKNYWSLIYDMGMQKNGLMNILVEKSLRIWKNVESGDSRYLESLLFYSNELTLVTFFGTSHKKHGRAHNDLIDYLKMYQSYEGLTELQSSHVQGQEVRLQFINFILTLKYSPTVITFYERFVFELVNYELELCKQRKHSYYPNSETHRTKIRIWQMILLLIGKLSKSFDYESLTKAIFEILYYDAQTSVKRFIEWSLILIFQINKDAIQIFWEYFKTGSEKKITTVVSVLSIAFYIAKLSDGESFVNFCHAAIPLIVPWTQGQHMTSRIHAQITLKIIWDKINDNEYKELQEKYHWVKYFYTLTEKNSAAVKHRQELLTSFFYSTFHPLDHYSLESIFHGILSQSQVLSDEYILIENLSSLTVDQNKDSKVVLNKFDGEVRSMKVIANQDKAISNSEASSDDEEAEKKAKQDALQSISSISPLIDVQKKIMPWNILPSADDTALNSELEKKRDSKKSELILCAVLIDKIPNIGGLCRTCEVFGANKLLVASNRYLTDPGFKSVSVSAEKWLDIEQVMPIKLARYLEEMKSEGYKVIGVEQTANSQQIGQFKFPEKTLLVLGNEKTGIPVDIIQLVDECVEIPQVGIIRSLNVHISGAIMVWEYCKQHLF